MNFCSSWTASIMVSPCPAPATRGGTRRSTGISTFEGPKTPFGGKRGQPGDERASPIVPSFYGVKLDRNDPYLERNLARLKKRFKKRYLDSVQKDNNRKKNGKLSHITTIRSIENNRRLLNEVRVLQKLLMYY